MRDEFQLQGIKCGFQEEVAFELCLEKWDLCNDFRKE